MTLEMEDLVDSFSPMNTLPKEIIIYISTFVNYETFINFKIISKKIYSIIGKITFRLYQKNILHSMNFPYIIHTHRAGEKHEYGSPTYTFAYFEQGYWFDLDDDNEHKIYRSILWSIHHKNPYYIPVLKYGSIYLKNGNKLVSYDDLRITMI
jgi:hypothetical protein